MRCGNNKNHIILTRKSTDRINGAINTSSIMVGKLERVHKGHLPTFLTQLIEKL